MLSGNYQDTSPIVAASTSLNGAAGIGIVRISGFNNLLSLQSLFSRDLGSIGPGRFYRTKVYDRTRKQIDDGGIVFFAAPNSYNGENILEVHLHGNPVLMKYFISTVVDLGLARYALAGEFSYRAFLNSKMNLSQVEGLDLILSSHSMKGIRQGVSSLDGELHQSFEKLYSCFIRFKSAIELNIDFLEDIGEEGGALELQDSFADFRNHLLSLSNRSMANITDLINAKIVLLGKTNAGKSTLFNHLLRSDRSIVSNEEGTTRDYVSENYYIGSDLFTLVDTAGLRKSEHVVEEEGIRRASKLFENAFFKILVINPLLDFNISEMVKLDELDLIVFTHSDEINFRKSLEKFVNFFPTVMRVNFSGLLGSIGPVDSFGPIEPYIPLDSGPIGPIGDGGPIEPVSKINSLVEAKYMKLMSNDPLLIERQCHLLQTLRDDVDFVEPLLDGDVAILSAEVARLGRRLSELVGIVSPDDVLHNIFNNFCIGK